MNLAHFTAASPIPANGPCLDIETLGESRIPNAVAAFLGMKFLPRLKVVLQVPALPT
jgi:hypothetical protein